MSVVDDDFRTAFQGEVIAAEALIGKCVGGMAENTVRLIPADALGVLTLDAMMPDETDAVVGEGEGKGLERDLAQALVVVVTGFEFRKEQVVVVEVFLQAHEVIVFL